MDILYSSSDSYAFLTGISLLSLLENNKQAESINIYIMDNSISELNKGKLINTVHSFDRQISFVPMPDIKKLTGHNIETGRWNISTFGRLFMASALPDSVHTVLNIDCDTIIEESLEDIFQINMEGKVFGGVQECINYRYRRNIGISSNDYYFNAGIVYLNLDEVRKEKYEQKFIDYIAKYGSSLAYLDQDVLNSIVEQEKKVCLPLKYDVLSIYFYANYDELLKIRRSNDFYGKEEYNCSLKKPTIVHFTTCFLDGLRPWIKGNKHPYRERFLEYKDRSMWKSEQLWNDKRGTLAKFKQRILCAFPRRIMCEIASVLHGIVVPNRSYRKMKREIKNER